MPITKQQEAIMIENVFRAAFGSLSLIANVLSSDFVTVSVAVAGTAASDAVLLVALAVKTAED